MKISATERACPRPQRRPTRSGSGRKRAFPLIRPSPGQGLPIARIVHRFAVHRPTHSRPTHSRPTRSSRCRTTSVASTTAAGSGDTLVGEAARVGTTLESCSHDRRSPRGFTLVRDRCNASAARRRTSCRRPSAVAPRTLRRGDSQLPRPKLAARRPRLSRFARRRPHLVTARTPAPRRVRRVAARCMPFASRAAQTLSSLFVRPLLDHQLSVRPSRNRSGFSPSASASVSNHRRLK
jgi:hypothetical protein